MMKIWKFIIILLISLFFMNTRCCKNFDCNESKGSGFLLAILGEEDQKNKAKINDKFEPNNSFEKAICLDKTIVDGNEYFKLTYDSKNNFDVDYFYINLESGKIFKSYINEYSNFIVNKLSFKIFDKNFNLISNDLKKSTFKDEYGYSSYFELEVNPQYTGRYYLRFELLSNSGISYNIKVLPNKGSSSLFFSYSNPCGGN